MALGSSAIEAESPPRKKPKKVTQLESEGEMLGEGAVENRLLRIEETQGRIEAMLIRLTTIN
jgi:hypothetical protein